MDNLSNNNPESAQQYEDSGPSQSQSYFSNIFVDTTIISMNSKRWSSFTVGSALDAIAWR